MDNEEKGLKAFELSLDSGDRDKKGKPEKEKDKRVGQEQVYDLLISRELSWQAIIYDLIRTEQLNPWDIDLAILANKYLETIQRLEELEEGNFHVSSKVLLAAAILLRMKSEILHENIKDIDEILFESKKKLRDELAKNPQIITIDEEDIPLIMPRTPLPRARKVTLQELMGALDKAINTEHRRIKKNFSLNRARHAIDLAIFPKFTFNLTKRIQNLFQKIKEFFFKNKKEKIMFSELSPNNEKVEKIGVFLPLVHLDHQQKIYLKQDSAFSDIEVYLRKKGEKMPGEEINSETEEDIEKDFQSDKVERPEADEPIDVSEEIEQNSYHEEEQKS
jgi:segregation and condensation protein A